MAGLVLSLFGPPQVELDSIPVEINRRKVMALLAYLAVTGRSHSRDTLATLFWPEYDQAQARAALRRTLSVLNKALPGWLEIDRELVALNRGTNFWLDVERFLSLASLPRSEDSPATLAEAVVLYRDDFMAGFTLPDSPDFDEWQFFQREELRRQMAGVLENLVIHHSTHREYEPAMGYARRRLNLDPLHEPAHRRLMELYALAGQRAAALRQYEECARLLNEELGAAPGPETLLEEAEKERLIRELKEDDCEPTTWSRFKGWFARSNKDEESAADHNWQPCPER